MKAKNLVYHHVSEAAAGTLKRVTLELGSDGRKAI